MLDRSEIAADDHVKSRTRQRIVRLYQRLDVLEAEARLEEARRARRNRYGRA